MKSLVLYRKVCNTVYCCGLDILEHNTRERIKELCAAGNAEIGDDRDDRYVICEIEGNCWDYSRDELAYLCKCYCEQMEDDE